MFKGTLCLFLRAMARGLTSVEAWSLNTTTEYYYYYRPVSPLVSLFLSLSLFPRGLTFVEAWWSIARTDG